jgi:hypothetical protein
VRRGILTAAGRALAAAFLALVPGASGCGPPAETFLPVAGQVTVNRSPLKTGTVTFLPDASKGNTTRHHPVGTINAEGRYELHTVGRKGAPPGWYKVVVHADENQQTGRTAAPLPPRWMTHVKYTAAGTTPLQVEVVEVAGRYDLKLTK